MKILELYSEVHLAAPALLPAGFVYDLSVLSLTCYQKYKILKERRVKLEFHSTE